MRSDIPALTALAPNSFQYLSYLPLAQAARVLPWFSGNGALLMTSVCGASFHWCQSQAGFLMSFQVTRPE